MKYYIYIYGVLLVITDSLPLIDHIALIIFINQLLHQLQFNYYSY